jgi:hypothetical protein
MPAHSRENGKKGGRPPGRKNNSTLEREAVQRAMDQRVMQLADRLLNAQLAHAEGVAMLFKRHKKSGKVERVTSEREIVAFLDANGTAVEHDGEVESDSAFYYFIATEKPSADAADRLLNRTFGKPKESVEHSGTVTVPGVVMFGITKAPNADCHD